MTYCVYYEFNPNEKKFERIFVDKWENNKDALRKDNEVNLLTSKSWKKDTAEKLLHKFKIKFQDSLAGSTPNPVQGFMDQVYDAPKQENNSLTGYYFENFFQSHDVILPTNFEGKNYEYNDDHEKLAWAKKFLERLYPDYQDLRIKGVLNKFFRDFHEFVGKLLYFSFTNFEPRKTYYESFCNEFELFYGNFNEEVGTLQTHLFKPLNDYMSECRRYFPKTGSSFID